MTLLGIPLAIAVLALYPALILVGFTVGVLFISRLLQAGLRKQAPGSLMGRLGYFAVALLLTLLISRVPFIGGVLVGLLALAGVGACVLELYGRRTGRNQRRRGAAGAGSTRASTLTRHPLNRIQA